MKSLAKNLTIMSMAIALMAMAGCKKPITPELPPELVLDKSEVVAPAEGGAFSVGYTVENPVEGATITPQYEAEWITDMKVGETEITFTVAATDIEQAREAEIILNYSEKDVTASFKVKQDGKTAPAEAFEIVIDEEDITYNSILVSVYPADKEMTYVIMGISEEYYTELGNDDAVIAALVEFMKSNADSYGMTIEAFMDQYMLEKGDVIDAPFEGYAPESVNYILAVGMTNKCETLTELYSEKFQLKAVEKVDMSFELSYEINVTDVLMKAVPSINDHYYYFDVARKADIDEMGQTMDEIAAALIADQVSFGAIFGMTPEDVIKGMCSLGADEYQYTDLNSETEYVGYAFGCSLAGVVDTDVTTKNFTTEKVSGSDNKITMEIGEVNVDWAIVNITTTNDDPYALVVDAVSNYSGMNDDQIIAELIKNDLSYNVQNGSKELRVTGLSANTEYYAFAMGYKSGVATTGLTKVSFTTIEAGDPYDFTYTFEASEVTSNSVMMNVVPTPNTVLYYWGIAVEGVTAEDIEAQIAADAQMWIDFGIYANVGEYIVETLCVRGESSGTIKGLLPETKYNVFAASYTETGDKAVDFVFNEAFTTKEAVVSSSTIRIEHDKFFDADEIAEAYPGEYDDFTGQDLYCMPMKVVTEGEVKSTYFTVFGEDLTDTEEWPDALLIQQLVDYGKGNTLSEVHYFLPYDLLCTIVAVAIDNDGNYTKVYREVVQEGRDGVSDISEFVPLMAPRQTKNFFEMNISDNIFINKLSDADIRAKAAQKSRLEVYKVQPLKAANVEIKPVKEIDFNKTKTEVEMTFKMRTK